MHDYQAKERLLGAAIQSMCNVTELNALAIAELLRELAAGYDLISDYQARQRDCVPDYVTNAAAREMQP